MKLLDIYQSVDIAAEMRHKTIHQVAWLKAAVHTYESLQDLGPYLEP